MTSRLPRPSTAFLAAGNVKADEKEVVFFFDEDLCFNIPFKPAAAPC